MASINKIQRTKGAVYKVTIRRTGLETICKTFPTKKEALTFSRKIEGNDLLLSVLGNSIASHTTLSELIEQYLKQYQKKDHNVPYRLGWWAEQFGHVPLNLFNTDHVLDGIELLFEKDLSGATINRYRAALSSAFKYAKKNRNLRVLDNPCHGIQAEPESKGRERFLSDDEQTVLLKACKESSWNKLYLLVLMALTTGARRGELLGLTWQDINFKRKTASLTNTKNGSSRLLPLTAPVIKELMHFRIIGNSLIFHNTVSTDRPYAIRKTYLKALDICGITNFRFHDLRHTSASNLAKNGATLLEIAEVLGHSNTTVTKRYAHLCINHKTTLISRVMGGLQ